MLDFWVDMHFLVISYLCTEGLVNHRMQNYVTDLSVDRAADKRGTEDNSKIIFLFLNKTRF